MPKDQLAESDDNRIRCKQFDEVVERWRRGKTSARAVIMEGIALLGLDGVFDQEGLGAMDVRHLYWKDLFIVAASHAA